VSASAPCTNTDRVGQAGSDVCHPAAAAGVFNGCLLFLLTLNRSFTWEEGRRQEGDYIPKIRYVRPSVVFAVAGKERWKRKKKMLAQWPATGTNALTQKRVCDCTQLNFVVGKQERFFSSKKRRCWFCWFYKLGSLTSYGVICSFLQVDRNDHE
jgi:hypothetical protein